MTPRKWTGGIEVLEYLFEAWERQIFPDKQTCTEVTELLSQLAIFHIPTDALDQVRLPLYVVHTPPTSVLT